MKKIIVDNYEQMSEVNARILADFVKKNPKSNICLPTGGSVVGSYVKLCEYVKNENISFKNINSYNMDEYVTLSKTDENSYYYFLNKHVYRNVDIDISNTFTPKADAKDLQKACEEYTERIDKIGGFDYIMLGIGTDGHIAFNMPNPVLSLDTHIEKLTEETINANVRFFEDTQIVPRQAISIGIGMIFKSKKIVLVASGEAKSDIIGRFLNNNVLNPEIPASILWLHNNVTIILDKDAACKIEQ